MKKTKNNNVMTIVEKTSKQIRSHIIIYRNSSFGYHFAEMDTIEQLERFSKMLGFSYALEDVSHSAEHGKSIEYRLSHSIDDNNSFMKLSDIPNGAKPFKALSNGSIVDCYFLNDGKTIHIYRPNPNAKNVYKPLDTKDHIDFVKNNYLC